MQHCAHIQLSSLPAIDQLLNAQVGKTCPTAVVIQLFNYQWLNDLMQGELEVKEIYRALMIIAAHLHLMIRDHHDESEAMRLRRHCHPMDLPLFQKNVRM